MSMRFVTYLLLAVMALAPATAVGGDIYAVPAPRDTTDHGGNLIDRFIAYLDDANKEKPMKRVDFSFIGGPSYSSDSKLGLGFVAAALYRRDLADTITPESNASLYGEVTTALLYSVGFRGNHIGRDDRMRVNYDMKVSSFPTAFWGIGFDFCKLDRNKVKYKDFRFDLKAEAVWRLGETAIYAGPQIEFAHIKALDIRGPEFVWQEQPLTTTDFGIGLTAMLDTRDHINSPERGWLLQLNQRFYPRVLGNHGHNFTLTEAGVNRYVKAWRGAVVAMRGHGYFTYGHTPWGLMGTIGGSYNMRGYYEARYRDKCEMDVTVELRQHVWKRSGVVVWGGAATVFPDFKELRWRHVLPNVGVGYRWEFKKRTNVRLDFGVGRGQTGFIFNINEAF